MTTILKMEVLSMLEGRIDQINEEIKEQSFSSDPNTTELKIKELYSFLRSLDTLKKDLENCSTDKIFVERKNKNIIVPDGYFWPELSDWDALDFYIKYNVIDVNIWGISYFEECWIPTVKGQQEVSLYRSLTGGDFLICTELGEWFALPPALGNKIKMAGTDEIKELIDNFLYELANEATFKGV